MRSRHLGKESHVPALSALSTVVCGSKDKHDYMPMETPAAIATRGKSRFIVGGLVFMRLLIHWRRAQRCSRLFNYCSHNQLLTVPESVPTTVR